MIMDKNTGAFFELLRAGLWKNEARLLSFGKIDWQEVYQLAEEQSVVGVVLAGLDLSDVKPPQELLLQWIGEVQILEQNNLAMNRFIAKLVEKMRKADIYALLVKGQGVAQCYEKPLWRACGDVDLFLSDENYEKAKELFISIASSVEKEYVSERHLGMVIDDFVVELHGTLHCGLSKCVDRGLDEIKRVVFYEGAVRSWPNDNTQIFLLRADEDAIYIFTHILQHFYRGGIGLRQISDWCRLLWTYRDSINLGLLEKRIRKMGLMMEWKTFGALAVEYLGMPAEAVPLYSPDMKWKRKTKRMVSFILEVGNFGHNRDSSYFSKYPYLIRKVCSMGRRMRDLIKHTRIFPIGSLRAFPIIILNGLMSTLRGE